MSISAIPTALNGIQSNFSKLADNTQAIPDSLKQLNTPAEAPSQNVIEKLSMPADVSIEEMLINNNQLTYETMGLLKSIKTEDELLGRLINTTA